jgi:Putative restriction endonuclease
LDGDHAGGLFASSALRSNFTGKLKSSRITVLFLSSFAMTIAKDQETMAGADAAPAQPEIVFPPSDLYSDEPPLENELHLRQLLLLIQCLEWLWRERNDFYAFGNLTIYYSPRQLKSEDFRGPDFFVVLGTERKPRKLGRVGGRGQVSQCNC